MALYPPSASSTPPRCRCFLRLSLVLVSARTAELRRNANALLLFRWSSSRADAQDEATQGRFNNRLLVCVCVPPPAAAPAAALPHRLHLAARLLLCTRYSPLPNMSALVGFFSLLAISSLLWFHKLLSQGRAADIVYGSTGGSHFIDHMSMKNSCAP